MLRLALCDDEIAETNAVKTLVDTYCAERAAVIECTIYQSPIELISAGSPMMPFCWM